MLDTWFRRTRREPWKGLAAGLVGGLVGSVVMTGYQMLWGKVAQAVKESGGAETSEQKDSRKGKQSRKKGNEESNGESDESSTVKVAAIISRNVLGHDLDEKEKPVAGNVVHFTFGILVAGLYGVAAEMEPRATVGAGVPFGSGVWLSADELALSALGLSKPPTQYPLTTHAYGLSAHLVYGATTELVRRAVRKAL